MMPVSVIREWLDHYRPTDLVGIDDGGLALRPVKYPGDYLEVGGLPEKPHAHDPQRGAPRHLP